MSGRTLLVVILALACGLAAFVGISLMNTNAPAEATVPVVVAVAEIRRGAPVTKDMVELRRVPEAMVPPAALGKLADAVDRIAGMRMIPGDAVTDAKLEPKGAKSRVVPAGKLAFTVARGDVPPLEADDHVDVYFQASGNAQALPPLQDIRVWDVTLADTKPGAANAQGPVTLLVDPNQANALNQGLNQGTLRLVRRNPDDPVQALAAPPPAAPAAPTGVAALIEPGMRAYALDTMPASVTVGGNLNVGDHVDVILTRKGGEKGRPISQTLPNILVVGTKTGLGITPADGQAVILSIQPQQATLLDRAAAEGTVHLALRKPGDTAQPAPPLAEAADALTKDINPGMRAFTFQAINPSVTLDGRIRQGDHVDVMMVVKPARGGEGMVSRTLPNVEVLSLPAPEETSGEEKQSVTLLVTPQEASSLALAQVTGTIYLTLRKPGDLENPPSAAAIEAELLNQSLSPGRRAFVLEAKGPSAAALCEAIRPGDRIDAFLVEKKEAGASQAPSRTLGNLEVIRVRNPIDSTTIEHPLLTLLVSPDEVLALARAQAEGSIHLALRKPGDQDEILQTSAPGGGAGPGGVVPSLRETYRSTITLRGTNVGADHLISRTPVPSGR